MTATFISVGPGRYTGTVNGRTFTLVRTRKTRTRTVHNGCQSWEKYRRSTTHTWYDVYEQAGAEVICHTASHNYPATRAEAEALVARLAG